MYTKFCPHIYRAKISSNHNIDKVLYVQKVFCHIDIYIASILYVLDKTSWTFSNIYNKYSQSRLEVCASKS